MENKIIFQGMAPFDLGVAQSAKAYGHTNNGVTVTINAILEGHGPMPISLKFQMVESVARQLADALMAAADASN
jgi:hypothetical protein